MSRLFQFTETKFTQKINNGEENVEHSKLVLKLTQFVVLSDWNFSFVQYFQKASILL